MSQPITNLAVGTRVWISESGTYAQYDIAGFNVHGSNTVTLVRTNVLASASIFGSSNLYENNTLDALLQNFETQYTLQHRALIQNANIIVASSDRDSGKSTILSRRVFALSRTEMTGESNGVIAENAQLPYFSTQSNRGKASDWWLRSMDATPGDNVGVYKIALDSYSHYVPYLTYCTYSLGVVPAQVIASTAIVQDAASSGAYYFVYSDFTPQAPDSLSPNGTYQKNDEAIELSWHHVIDTGTAQTKADLQIAASGGTWSTLATITGNGATYTIAPNALANGTYSWRCRTYNTDGVAGPWASAIFIVIGAPPLPTISSISSASRPVIGWQSSGQIAYHMQIVNANGETVYDTDELSGAFKTSKITAYLAPGTYTLRLCVKNASLVWSAWAERAFTLSATGPAAPTIALAEGNGGAQVTLSAVGVRTYLLRDGVPIADVTGLTHYTDYAALGLSEYVVRTVDVSDNYTDSSTGYLKVSVANPTLAAVDDLSNMVALPLTVGNPRELPINRIRMGTARYYAGREDPVYFYSGFSEKTFPIDVAFPKGEGLTELLALLDRRKTLLYRDQWGNKWYCVCTTDAPKYTPQYVTVTLTITAVSYNEQIDYAG